MGLHAEPVSARSGQRGSCRRPNALIPSRGVERRVVRPKLRKPRVVGMARHGAVPGRCQALAQDGGRGRVRGVLLGVLPHLPTLRQPPRSPRSQDRQGHGRPARHARGGPLCHARKDPRAPRAESLQVLDDVAGGESRVPGVGVGVGVGRCFSKDGTRDRQDSRGQRRRSRGMFPGRKVLATPCERQEGRGSTASGVPGRTSG